MNITNHIIYGLIDPNTKELRYIGYSSDIDQRYYDHHIECKLKKNTHKNHWIKLLLKNNQKAELYIIEYHNTAEELPEAEIEMIAYYKSIGCDLTNYTNGGDGWIKGTKMSEVAKRKISIANTGKKHTEETKKHLSIVHTGKKVSDYTKTKISKTLMGHNNNPNKGKTWKLIDGKRIYFDAPKMPTNSNIDNPGN